MIPMLRRCLALLLIICTLTVLVACSTDQPEETTAAPTETEPEVTEPIEEAVEVIDIIKDGKLLYPIIRPDSASQTVVRAALKIHRYIGECGIESDISDWGDKTGEKNEILFGISKFFPKEALDGIDLSALGWTASLSSITETKFSSRQTTILRLPMPLITL